MIFPIVLHPMLLDHLYEARVSCSVIAICSTTRRKGFVLANVPPAFTATKVCVKHVMEQPEEVSISFGIVLIVHYSLWG